MKELSRIVVSEDTSQEMRGKLIKRGFANKTTRIVHPDDLQPWECEGKVLVTFTNCRIHLGVMSSAKFVIIVAPELLSWDYYRVQQPKGHGQVDLRNPIFSDANIWFD